MPLMAAAFVGTAGARHLSASTSGGGLAAVSATAGRALATEQEAIPFGTRPQGMRGHAAALSMIACATVARAATRGHQRKRTATTRRAAVTCSPEVVNDKSAPDADVGVILLSAGVGKRMRAGMPKQYMKLNGREIALYSFEVFLSCPDVAEIVVVCDDVYRCIFQRHLSTRGGGSTPTVRFTNGGAERQDSVKSGLRELTTKFAAVHDSARPLVTMEEVLRVIADARAHGAAILGVNTKATIKQASAPEGETCMIECTPDRSLMWEAHTPQVVRRDILIRGFENAEATNLTVTDDASLVEALGERVKLTQGEPTNIKVTTPEDIAVAEAVLASRHAA